MDTSKEYIKMCEKAKELQSSHTLKIGDYVVRFWRPENAGWRIRSSAGDGIVNWISIDSHTIIGNNWAHYRDEVIWLPYQDQLQELLKDSHTLGAILRGLYWFYDDDVTCKCAEIGIARRKMLDTIEQFTLAFVMDELYKKKWNDEGERWEDAQASIENV